MTDKIKKFLAALDPKTKTRLDEKIELARKSPFVGKNIKKMSGYGKNVYRLRVGGIRIIYIVLEDRSLQIVDVDYRGNIY